MRFPTLIDYVQNDYRAEQLNFFFFAPKTLNIIRVLFDAPTRPKRKFKEKPIQRESKYFLKARLALVSNNQNILRNTFISRYAPPTISNASFYSFAGSNPTAFNIFYLDNPLFFSEK